MPKLKGNENKQLFGYQVDKENSDVFFNDEKHIYLDKLTGEPYISVTTLIHNYEPEFNELFFARYKALEELADYDRFSIIKQQLLNTQIFKYDLLEKLKVDKDQFEEKVNEILKTWHNTRDEACEHGTYVHSLYEETFYGKTHFDLSNYDSPDVCGEFKCVKGYYPKKLEEGMYPEYLVSWVSPEGLHISGQVDLLCLKGNELRIYDYKGLALDTPILTTSGWKTMGTLTLEDEVFDKDGNTTKILHISEEHNNPCYKIKFDNGDELTADEDHRWLISFFQRKGKYKTVVMTTKELYKHLKVIPRNSYTIPKVFNPAPLKTTNKQRKIDPYVLGAWLGDGSKSCGIITNVSRSFWDEIQKRGYKISENLSHDDHAEMRTVYGLRTELRELGLLNNKRIPEECYLWPYKDRLDLLRGIMDTDGYYHPKRKRFVIGTTQRWQAEDTAKLICSLGWKPTLFDVIKTCNGKKFDGFDVCFSTNKENPFLTRNQDVEGFGKTDKSSFRNIISIESVETVTTKCIEVDSPTHTYLAGEHLIVTHNTNKQIKKRGYFNSAKKKNVCMKYPLNDLEACNYNTYQMQLSTYAYMVQQLNPEVEVKELKLIHIDRDGKQTIYPCKYLKEEVERMIKHYAKSLKTKELLDRDKPFIV